MDDFLGYNMGHEGLNLNEPPAEVEHHYYVMLHKDEKPICRVRCLSPPTEVFANLSTR